MPVSSKKSDSKSLNGNSSRVKLRWMELDVEGVTTDLVEGFKSFATALTRGKGSIEPRVLAPPKPTSTSTVAMDDDVPEESENLETNSEGPEDDSSPVILGNGSDRPKRRAAPKAPKFLSELDLTKAPTQLADFVQAKNPDGDMDKYAVIAVWFKQFVNTDEITIDHIFTAYKALGWQAQLPDDLSQTFRNLKNNKNWFDSGSKRGCYKVNWNGESAVTKMGVARS